MGVRPGRSRTIAISSTNPGTDESTADGAKHEHGPKGNHDAVSSGDHTAATRVDQYDGVIVLNNDRVITAVQIGNLLVIGNAWTDANDWMSSEIDLQIFKWQSLRETISAIAYLDRVVSMYQRHR